MDKQPKKHSVKDKTVVITGASSGVGRAAAIAFAKKGARVVLAARNTKALTAIVNECKEMGALAIGVPTDVTDANAMKELAHTAIHFSGQIDIWINNAGVLSVGGFNDIPLDVHHRTVQTNLMGYIYGAYAVMPYFRQQGSGILINNISVGGWFAVPYGVSYSASKFGLRGFSEALRGELSRYPNIHICNLYPALLDTPGIQHAANYTGALLKPMPPVYDPQRVARTMVHVAKYPRNSVTVGSMATLIKTAATVAPKLTRTIAAKVIEGYVNRAEPIENTSGNLFKEVEYGTSIHGGWNTSADAKARKRSLGTGLLLLGAVAAGVAVYKRRSALSGLIPGSGN